MRTSQAPVDLLATLGQRVRRAREARGESRAAVAVRAGLSPRYLAQLEGGTGNISVLRLRDLAQALEVDGATLLAGVANADSGAAGLRGGRFEGADEATPAAGVPRLRDEVAAYLESRSAAELREVRDWLATRFARTSGPLVALLGLRGAGKSSVGRTLARRLRVEFFELDSLIEETAGMELAQLFELQGPTRYRQLEREALRRFLATTQAGVLATGGGIVTEPETFALLRQRCLTVWLRARPEEHWERVVQQGDRRPMRGNPDAMHELRALLASREPLYAQAHVTQDTSGASAATIARTLAGIVREQPALTRTRVARTRPQPAPARRTRTRRARPSR